jgi:hypothetical protein
MLKVTLYSKVNDKFSRNTARTPGLQEDHKYKLYSLPSFAYMQRLLLHCLIMV